MELNFPKFYSPSYVLRLGLLLVCFLLTSFSDSSITLEYDEHGIGRGFNSPWVIVTVTSNSSVRFLWAIIHFDVIIRATNSSRLEI